MRLLLPPGMCEVVVDLPPHSINLLLYGRRHLRVAGSPRSLCLVSNDRERCLQPVRQVACFGDRAAHRPLTLVQERVQIVDEWLHFRRVASLDTPIPSSVKLDKTGAQVADRGHAGANLQKAGCHADHSHRQNERLPEEVVRRRRDRHRRVKLHGGDEERTHHDHEANGPEHRSEKQPVAE
jgi:hypothetical protein